MQKFLSSFASLSIHSFTPYRRRKYQKVPDRDCDTASPIHLAHFREQNFTLSVNQISLFDQTQAVCSQTWQEVSFPSPLFCFCVKSGVLLGRRAHLPEKGAGIENLYRPPLDILFEMPPCNKKAPRCGCEKPQPSFLTLLACFGVRCKR